MKTNRQVKEQTMHGFARRAKTEVKRGDAGAARSFARAAARLYFEVYGRCQCWSEHRTHAYSILHFCPAHPARKES